MKREKFFSVFYGYFEVLIDVSSGLFLMLGTNEFLRQYIPGYDSVIDSPAGILLADSFGLMTFMSGLLQYAIINMGDQKTRRYGLGALLCGDVLQLLVSGFYFINHGEWTMLYIFNFIFTSGLAISRSYFLITGVPGRKYDTVSV